MVAARRLAKRAFRQNDRRFLVEGPQAVAEAVATVEAEPGSLVELFATAEAVGRHGDLLRRAAAAGVAVFQVSGEVLAALAATVTPQGLVGVAAFRDVDLPAALAGVPKLVAVLVDVRDPGNAGTVLRTADAAGADAVIFSASCVDPYNGKCVRATAGSLFHLSFVAGAPIGDAVAALRGAGLQVLAAAGDAAADLDSVADAGELAPATGWLFGNESWGLTPEVLALADRAVRVPIHGRAESLNLSSAAAVCLYSSARAQREAATVGRRPTGEH